MTGRKRTYLDRSKAIPGLTHAFRMTMKAAVIASDKKNGGRDEERFYDLKLKMTRRVAELWELSPMMEQYLIQRWVEEKVKPKVELREEDFDYFGTGDSSDRSMWTGQGLELEILLTGKEPSELAEVNSELEMSETRVIAEKETRNKHLYLDVTGLGYRDLRNAYEAITRCRKMLGLELRDVRRGAPESMDFTRALTAARLEERGFSRKEVAEMLDFKIYSEDVPSGTYPLLQKYLKVGREILRKLNRLEEYIHELTGIAPGTL